MIEAFCTSCNTFHKLDASIAIPHAKELLNALLSSRQLDFESEQSVHECSTRHLYGPMGGKMFGVLVCENGNGNEIVLKAFSGKYNDYRSIPGWVPHLFDKPAFDVVIAEGNTLIHPLTEAIAQETDPSQKQSLIAQRKAVSHVILKKLYDLYAVYNFNGEKRSLQDAFSGTGSIPTGTGDCCAPKLLNYAARNGLKPISLAEFYVGKPLKKSDKAEGEFYNPCTEKCGPLLGFMLCGAIRT